VDLETALDAGRPNTWTMTNTIQLSVAAESQ
jgi:hypothetical protein